MSVTEEELRALLAHHKNGSPGWEGKHEFNVMSDDNTIVATFYGRRGLRTAESKANCDFAVEAHRLAPSMAEELLFLRRVIADMADDGKDVSTVTRYRKALERIRAEGEDRSEPDTSAFTGHLAQLAREALERTS